MGVVRCLVALCALLCIDRMAVSCVCVCGACWAVRVACGFHATPVACPNARRNNIHMSNVSLCVFLHSVVFLCDRFHGAVSQSEIFSKKQCLSDCSSGLCGNFDLREL